MIPVWRDHAALPPLVKMLQGCREVCDVVIALAEPAASAIRLAEEWGVRAVDAGAPNRGGQMDAGASATEGEWLLFHHADSLLTPAHLVSLAALDRRAEIVGGAFYRQFDERHPRMRRCEVIERWHNRTFGALYGDQSLFVRRSTFEVLGGFRGLPLMEDVDFSLRLRRHGRLALLDPPMASSPRRHLADGPWRCTLLNAWLLLLFKLGVPPARLHARYYRRGAAAEPDGSLLERRVRSASAGA